MSTPCSTQDCGNEARPDRPNQEVPLCWRCWKRKVRRVPLSAPVQERGSTPWQSLLNAIHEFSEAAAEAPDGDAVAAWKRIQGRLRKALDRYNARMRARKTRRSA